MADRSLKNRALLTETLPFEVPLIFSNEGLHASLSLSTHNPEVEKVLAKLRGKPKSYSKPYSYEIAKSETRTTTLGIIHPQWQVEISNFYERHAGSLLNFCSDESFSLRRPADIASPFTEKTEDDDSRLKFGLVQQASEGGEPDVSHMTSYFVYRKYNLLGKFIDSREYLRLESRFKYARTLDISKCFYNIYTHSVTWATKDKEFAKSYSKMHAVEFDLDILMQKSNYNETNGIVVGPEFSRIFAEIILQRVDKEVRKEMLALEYEATRDYDIRRYVDDYTIFSNSSLIIEQVESSLRKHLEFYKLYLNEGKAENLTRPFVSPLSLARQEVARLLRELSGLIGQIKAPEGGAHSIHMRGITRLLREVRMIVKKHDVGFESISGWLFSRLKKTVKTIFRHIKDEEQTESKDDLIDVALSILESSFHILSLDVRVRHTYSICQLAIIFHESRSSLNSEQCDTLDHILMEGFLGLLRTMRVEGKLGKQPVDSVEAYNLMIAAAHFLGAEFTRTATFKDSVDLILQRPKITYFCYISLKYCLLKDVAEAQARLDTLNSRIKIHLLSAADIHLNSEDYLLLCDYISAPDVLENDKCEVLRKLLGGTPSKATAVAVGPHLGFVDWTGLSLRHLLRRKSLRPVYAWA